MVQHCCEFSDRVSRISIDMDIAIDAKLHICLAQLPCPDDSAMLCDSARPVAVAAFTQLFAGGGGHDHPALQEMIPGKSPVLVVFPELAFGSTDWCEVDAVIRKVKRPIIVIAGFGFTEGKAITRWARAEAQEGETRRLLAWDQKGNAISEIRRVNGGWCWVHVPGDTYCITYLKTIPEQNVEAVEVADLQCGQTITHLKFNDVDLFPLICADMLKPANTNPDSAQAKIAEVLAELPVNRRAMVVGSLLQRGYNENWERAISSLTTSVFVKRPGVVVLSNIATDAAVPEEEKDRWRSFTGVYGKWEELSKGQANLPCSRGVTTTDIVGAVVRYSDARLTSGVVDWGPYNPVDGKFLWHANMMCSVNSTGLEAPISSPPQPHACEICRFLQRHPNQTCASTRLKSGRQHVISHLKQGHAPQGQKILNALLHGPSEETMDPDRLHEIDVQPAARLGLEVLATLTTIDGIDWQKTKGQQGQLRHTPSDSHILIWRDARKTKSQMRAILSRWMREGGPHPSLVVIGQSPFGDLDTTEVSEERRDDLTAPPLFNKGDSGEIGDGRQDFTFPHARRRAATIGLSCVADIYAEHQQGADDTATVKLFLEKLDSALRENSG